LHGSGSREDIAQGPLLRGVARSDGVCRFE
jgi:hypothetical protein